MKFVLFTQADKVDFVFFFFGTDGAFLKRGEMKQVLLKNKKRIQMSHAVT